MDTGMMGMLDRYEFEHEVMDVCSHDTIVF